MTAIADRPANPLRYTNVAIALHWAIAAMIFGLIGSGFAMMNLMGQGSELQYNVYQVHKSFGVMVLILTVARVLWRVFNRPPEEPDSVTALERKASHFVHMAFYSMMILIPLSGWVLITVSPIQVETVLFFQSWLPWPHVPGLTTLSESTQELFYFLSHYAHAILAYGALILGGLHIAGALKHQLADGDFIQRMLPARGGGGQTVGFGHATAWSAALVFAVAMIGAGAVARMDPNVVADASDTSVPSMIVAAVDPAVVVAAVDPAVVVAAVDPAAEATAVALATPPAPTAAAWARDPAVGGLTFTMDFDGETIEGAFAAFETEIVFDPDNLAGSSVAVTIDTGSATLSSRSLTQSQLTGSDGFAVSDFPVATFASDAIRADGDGYLADGTLTIRDTAVPQTLAFTVDIDGDRAVASGRLAVDRFDYGIGTRGDDAGTTLAPEITVEFNLEADRVEPGASEVAATSANDGVDAAAVQGAPAPLWTLQRSDSSLTFRFDFDGDEMVAAFERFDAAIRFDPDNLPGSSLNVSVDLGSAALSTRGVSDFQLKGSDGFDVSRYPTATFIADTIQSVPDGYEAVGSLSLRGVDAPVVLPFTLLIEDNVGRARASVVLDRAAFGIAEGADNVGEGVTVDVVITAELAGSIEAAVK